jgi:phosphate transport system protein
MEKLERRLLFLGARVEEAVRKSIKALLERRSDLATQVVEGDDSVDREEVEIEEDCLKILALHQPVATDLRFIAACLKINNDLERIGDLAVNIANRARLLLESAPVDVPAPLEEISEISAGMLRSSLDAFVKEDARAAREVLAADSRVDALHRDVIDGLIADVRRGRATVDKMLPLFSVSKNLERIADHATNIAEDVVYLVEGEIIRHQSVPRHAK